MTKTEEAIVRQFMEIDGSLPRETRQKFVDLHFSLCQKEMQELVKKIEGIIESREYKAMVQMGDLSFLNYTPTEIYNLALSDFIHLIKKHE